MWGAYDPRMTLTLTCVVDNHAQPGSDLRNEHGLAFWITSEAGPVLFDTGQTGAVLLHNLAALGLAAPTLKALALSHAHYDHTGGLPALAEQLAPDLPLYANSDLLRERFSQHDGIRRAIGLSVDANWLQTHFTLHLDDHPQQILPGVWTTGAITARPHPGGYAAHHEIRAGTGYAPDPYRDDLSLVLESARGLVVVCGCCHAGLLNTLEHVQRLFAPPIVAVVGGTHLAATAEDALAHIARTLHSWGTLRRIYLNHCSGEKATHVLRQVMGNDTVHPCPAGTILDMEAEL